MTLTCAQEPQAEALAIQKLFGADGPRWIAERIGSLTLAGDVDGVERFKGIAAAYEQLLASEMH